MSNGDRVRAVLRDAGWSDIRLERFDIEHSIGIDVADAASVACQMGTMAEPFAQADDATKRNVMSTIRHALEPSACADGLRHGLSTWITSATRPCLHLLLGVRRPPSHARPKGWRVNGKSGWEGKRL